MTVLINLLRLVFMNNKLELEGSFGGSFKENFCECFLKTFIGYKLVYLGQFCVGIHILFSESLTNPALQ